MLFVCHYLHSILFNTICNLNLLIEFPSYFPVTRNVSLYPNGQNPTRKDSTACNKEKLRWSLLVQL